MNTKLLPRTTLTHPRAAARIAGLLALVLLFPLAAHAGTAEGIAAFEAGDYERAYKELRPEAEAGDAEAQYYLAQMYDYGDGVEKDSEKALELFRMSAEQDHPAAQVALGFSYDEGIGVPVDDEKAVALYGKAANAGDAVAQRNLGLMYREGEGVKRDYEQAAEWFRKAAEQGDSGAQLELGIAYAKGRGVEQDHDKAAYWNKKAAAAGEQQAKRKLAWQYVAGEGVDKDLDEAARLYRDLLDEENPKTYFNLGRILMEKGRVDNDEEAFAESYHRFREAASMKHAQSMMYLGMCYINGWGVARDKIEGVAWEFLSAEFGHGAVGGIWLFNESHMTESELETAQERATEIMAERGWSD